VYIILEDIEKNPLRENALFTELDEEEEVDNGYFNVKVIDTTKNSDPRESMSFIISQGLFCILQESLMEVYTKGSQYILNQMGDNVVDLLPNLLNKAKGPPNGSGYH
tara:strand:+ start:3869 stop:4189 length:321 start_codon:yes stop_codon:yes gene_type:complete